MAALLRSEESVVDVVGIGLGPSNLALAIAIEEFNQKTSPEQVLTAAFFEKQPSFGWHRGMLIEGATMQVSFLKDLVTMRNAVSPYGFLAYLQDKDRLADFINARSFFPLRIEFHDYLEWVAERFRHVVDYGCEVVEVRPVVRDGATELLDVVVRQGAQTFVQRTRNIVIAIGLEPSTPEVLPPSERVWHSSSLLMEAERFAEPSPRSFVVVGAGQSGAEAVEYLHREFPSADVHAVFSRYGYSVSDDSAFTNRIFDPQAVDHHFDASDDVKRALYGYHANTNYGVVDIDLIEDLYRRLYLENVTGRRRLHIRNTSRITAAEAGPDGVRVDVEFLPTRETTTLHADAVVCATGYRPADPVRLLGELASSCKQDEHGRLQVMRDYRVAGEESLRCGVYLQGGTEHSHGLSSSLLSNVAVRSGEIVDSLVRGRAGSAAPARPPVV
ncbi:lysine N(6)-hydroxylase/L-ornithine N(5)-oxygenase family protein [Streptomyces sp. NPDC057638]|uniref:lysine N(6)-hydroxylase/L-ornithine N(5)-oxygenase family protein n=1 Tax=Streptomyces sp. NPDC057638 TaxID=3346190 RepID=UPI003688351E